MTTYKEFHARSIRDPEGFWGDQAQLIDWKQPFDRVLDYSRPPFARWFVGGTTNLCHNAVDRHLATRGDQPALIFVSTETGDEKTTRSTSCTARSTAWRASSRGWGSAAATAC
jgi:propionyl-CoA synthetase